VLSKKNKNKNKNKNNNKIIRRRTQGEETIAGNFVRHCAAKSLEYLTMMVVVVMAMMMIMDIYRSNFKKKL
jgi:hypothetical protein